MGKIEGSYTKRSNSLRKRKKHNRTSYVYETLDKKAITSENYNHIIMIIDMSKAFDTVNRKTLLGRLETILDESEMRMMYLLINNVKLKVRMGKCFGEETLTNIGVAQGDCLSAILFIFYLAQFVDVMPALATRKDYGKKFYGQNSIGS